MGAREANAVNMDSSALKILLVEDDRAVRITLRDALEEAAHRVAPFDNGASALTAAETERFDLLITDIRLPGLDGVSLFRRLRQLQPECDALLITAFGTIDDAVAVMREGAQDYITKPFEMDELMLRVDRIAQARSFRRILARGCADTDDALCEARLVGASPAMEEVRSRVQAAAESDVNVLITGETGTGKELCARALHLASARAKRPFIAVNCASIPSELFEAEMFGHEKGAFTGAVRRREGRMLTADGGTLFLDEVGELPLQHQAKLLRALDSQTFEPVGSSRPVTVDLRVLAATNRELQQDVEAGSFRADLLFRLQVLDIVMPPLRERPSDIPLLVSEFLNRTADRHGASPPRLAPGAIAALISHDYPGNVRELFHALEHGLALARGGEIDLQHLPNSFRHQGALLGSSGAPLPLTEAVRQFEQTYIRRMLDAANGKRGEAAKRLGISRKSLWQKLKQARDP